MVKGQREFTAKRGKDSPESSEKIHRRDTEDTEKRRRDSL